MLPGTDRRRRRAALLGAALLGAALLVAAVVPVGAQSVARAWTELEPPQPVAGDSFRLRIHVRGGRLDSMRVLEPALPDGLQWISGPEAQPLAGAPLQPRERVISYTLRARRAGRYVLDGFLVRLASESLYTTDTVFAVVEVAPAATAKPTVAWIPARTRAVVGETVSLQLVLGQSPALQLPERVEVRPPSDGWFEQYRGQVAISEQVAAGGRLYRVPLAAYLLTPTRAGTITVPSARVTLRLGNSPTVLFSEAVTLEVRAAPPEIAATGAVGALQARTWIEQRQLPAGLEVAVHTAVSGTGNHRFATLPEPDAPGLALVDRALSEELTLRDAGYRGRIQGTHRYLVTDPGSYLIQVPEFVHYDPERASVVHAPGLSHVVELSAAAAVGGGAGPALAPAPPELELRRGCVPPWRRWPTYLLLLPGALLGAAAALRVRGALRGRALPLLAALAVAAGGIAVIVTTPAVEPHLPDELRAALARAEHAFQSRDYGAARTAYTAVLDRLHCLAAVRYNLARTEQARGDLAAAIAVLRAATRTATPNPAAVLTALLGPDRGRAAPLGLHYRRLLVEMETAAGLETQHRAPPFLPPALLFSGLLVAANAAGLAAWAAARPGGRAALVAVLRWGGVTGVALALLLTAAAIDLTRELVVVRATDLRRIPVAAAAPWVALPAGTTLQVRGAHQDHLLVRTAYGLDAWVNRAAVVAVSARGR